MDLNFNFAQAIGIVATIFIITAFSQKRDNHLKFIGMAGSLLFALHFLLLGAYAGAIVNIVNAFRSGLSIKFHRSTKMMVLFIFVYLFLAILTFEQIINLLPYISGILGAYSLYQLSGIPMRVFGLIGSFLWLTYNIIFMSIGGIITECFVISVNCITIYRIFKDNKKLNETPS